MSNEKRMAGSYEIIHAMQIGDKEIVIGEDTAAAPGQQYMCAFCEQNDFFARYEQVLSSDDYAEIVGIFGWRVTESAEEIRRSFSELDLQGEQNPTTPSQRSMASSMPVAMRWLSLMTVPITSCVLWRFLTISSSSSARLTCSPSAPSSSRRLSSMWIPLWKP